MKILLISYACDPEQGSEAGVGWRVLRLLAKNHHVSVVTHNQEAENISRAQKEGKISSQVEFVFEGQPFRWHPNRMVARWQSWLEYAKWLRRASQRVAEICAEKPIDLVHHLTITTWRLPPVKVPAGIPLVWGPLGGTAQFPLSLLGSMSMGSALFEILRNLLNQFLLRNPALRRACLKPACIIGSSAESVAWLNRMVKSRVPVRQLSASFFSDEKILTFRALFTQRNHEAPLRAFAGGNLIGSKGVGFALRALKLVKDRGVIVPYTVASFGPEKSYLENLAAGLGIRDQVVFHPGFAGLEYQKVLMEHSVFLLPSFREGSPGTILEAMLAGQIPVVIGASAQGEIVESKCGFSVKVGTEQDICKGLAEALIQLHENTSRRKAMAQTSHQKILKEYRESLFLERLEAIYNFAAVEARQRNSKR